MYHCDEYKMLSSYYSDRSREESDYYSRKMLIDRRRRNEIANRRYSHEVHDAYDIYDDIDESEYWKGL